MNTLPIPVVTLCICSVWYRRGGAFTSSWALLPGGSRQARARRPVSPDPP